MHLEILIKFVLHLQIASAQRMLGTTRGLGMELAVRELQIYTTIITVDRIYIRIYIYIYTWYTADVVVYYRVLVTYSLDGVVV